MISQWMHLGWWTTTFAATSKGFTFTIDFKQRASSRVTLQPSRAPTALGTIFIERAGQVNKSDYVDGKNRPTLGEDLLSSIDRHHHFSIYYCHARLGFSVDMLNIELQSRTIDFSLRDQAGTLAMKCRTRAEKGIRFFPRSCLSCSFMPCCLN